LEEEQNSKTLSDSKTLFYMITHDVQSHFANFGSPNSTMLSVRKIVVHIG